MKTEVKKEVRVTLVLDENEAKWLKARMQNPMIIDKSLSAHEKEDKEERKMRQMFWETLTIENI
jgi:hypothetical protein